MNKKQLVLLGLAIMLFMPIFYGFTPNEENQEEEIEVETQSLASLAVKEERGYGTYITVKEVEDSGNYSIGSYEMTTSDFGVCSTSSTKTYMDYRAITSKSSAQYKYIQANMTVDEETGLLMDEYGFIGVALGSYYGKIGDRYLFVLDNGTILPFVKVEEKADNDTTNGCYHDSDSSVIEFVLHKDLAAAYFGKTGNGLVSSGNLNNYDEFRGKIAEVQLVTDIFKEEAEVFDFETSTVAGEIGNKYKEILIPE